jgi:hypothetical protein
MSLTGQNKTASSSLVATAKTAATLLGFKKSGAGWDYDQADINYDMVEDAQGRDVLYNSLGQATTLTGLDKTAA